MAAMALPLVICGCAVGPDFVRPAPPAVDRYTRDGQVGSLTALGQTQTLTAGGKVVADWWRLFGSAELDAAVAQAMRDNATLQSAQANLRQSQETLRAGYGVFFPSIDLGFAATRQRASLLQAGASAAGAIFNLFTLSASVSYVLDVFGGERRTVEALAAQADYQRYTMLATYLSLSGNVVNTLIARAAYQAQIQATAELIARQQEQLDIAQTQATAGTAPYANALSIQSQLDANRASIPALLQRRDQAEHLLATLAGQPPAQFTPPQIDLAKLSLPRDLPLSLPSELVRQRPDILASEAQLHVASANIGIATAALFPRFSLSGAYGRNSTTISNLTDAEKKFWNSGSQASMPLFQGGSLVHQRRAAVEAYRGALANYRQTVLTAFAQVADTLAALAHDAQALQAQADALAAAGQALRLVEANYQAGLVNYVNLLVADTQYLQARIGYLQALAQRHQDTTALFLALGGGWWNAERP